MGIEKERGKARNRELDTYKRQTAIFNPQDYTDKTVTVIGLGNIGSHVVMALARMGISRIAVVDFDTVEAHNLASQAYELSHVGRKKVDAITELVGYVAGTEIEAYAHAYNATVPVTDITVVAVDSIETRRAIGRVLQGKDTHIIDGRMGGGQVEVHTGKPDTWLLGLPDTADTDNCAARYISYTSYMIAGLIANTVKRTLVGQEVPTGAWLHTDTLSLLTA